MKIYEMKFEELYRIVNDGRKLRKFVEEESLRMKVHPSEVLFLLIKVYRDKVREMAERN